MRFLAIAVKQNIFGTYRFSLVKLYLLAASVSLLCLSILLVGGFNHLVPISPSLVALYTLASGLQAIQLAVINAARLRQQVASLQIADALLRPAIILLIALLVHRSSSYVMTAYVLTSLIMVPLSIAAFAAYWPQELYPEPSSIEGHDDDKLLMRMVSFTWPFVMFGMLGAIGSHGERLLLINFVSWQDLGIYSLMAQLALAPSLMLTSVINQFYLPVIYQSDPLGATQLGRSYKYYLALSAIGVFSVALAVATLGRWIVPLFSSASFSGHEHLLWFLALSAGIFNLGQQLVLPGMRRNKLSYYLPSKFLHSLVLVAAAFLFAPKWGMTGMALASTAAATVYTLSVIWANARIAKSASA